MSQTLPFATFFLLSMELFLGGFMAEIEVVNYACATIDLLIAYFFIFFLVENQCSRGKCYFLREIFPQKACFVFIKVVTLQSFRAASAVL